MADHIQHFESQPKGPATEDPLAAPTWAYFIGGSAIFVATCIAVAALLYHVQSRHVDEVVTSQPVLAVESMRAEQEGLRGNETNYYDPEKNQPGDFPEPLMDRLSGPMTFAESVLFGGYGEPLLSPSFPLLLDMAVRHRCRSELITNG